MPDLTGLEAAKVSCDPLNLSWVTPVSADQAIMGSASCAGRVDEDERHVLSLVYNDDFRELVSA